jgi:cytochrome c oxidase subunit 2
MNRLSFFVALSALFALFVAPLVATSAAARSSMDIVASNWKFTPGAITLHVGQTKQLRFTSRKGVHGVQSNVLGIPQTTIMPGKFIVVSVTPKKTGTYVIHCSIFCGAGHPNMRLTVKVVSK